MNRLFALVACICLAWACPAWAGGIAHGNLARTGYSREDFPAPYRLAWVHDAPQAPRPAWAEPAWEPQRIDFDYAYAVASDGPRVYYASSSDHGLHALDAATGRELWVFYTEGPVRLAPEMHGANVLFGSDDGWLYCVSAAKGELVWKYRPDMPDFRMVGNEQIISRWPCRSGVAIEGDRVYTTFGMLSPEGVAVACLDARTGQPIWLNDTCGYHYMARPHSTAMGGVSPQGYLAVDEQRLVVACGRSTPALFDKHTGRVLYHEADGDFTGGARVMLAGGLVFTQADTLKKEYGSDLRREDDASESEIFELATLVALDGKTGHEVFSLRGGSRGAISPGGLITLIGRKELLAVELPQVQKALGKPSVIAHTLGHFVEGAKIARWRAEVDRVYALRQAGETILAGGRDLVEAFSAADGKRLWSRKVQGQARAMCLADGRWIVSTTAGRIYCFVPGQGADALEVPVQRPVEASSPRPMGYCLAMGPHDANQLADLARQSDLVVYISPEDPSELRAELARRGLQGVRVAVHRLPVGPTAGVDRVTFRHISGGGISGHFTGSWHREPLPYTDYLADTVVIRAESQDSALLAPLKEAYRLARPWGGRVLIQTPQVAPGRTTEALVKVGIPPEEVGSDKSGAIITRGPLAGAGQWTHQYADPGKSAASEETLVRLPLKAAWFGGLGPAPIVSRHFRQPAPLVIDGRCFVIGLDSLVAMNIYNGRILWQRDLPDLARWPAAYRGPGAAVDHEAVYVLRERSCLVLDPQTGRTLGELPAPLARAGLSADDAAAVWEYLAVTDKLIVGSLGKPNVKTEWWSKAAPGNVALFALNKADGQVAWVHKPSRPVDSSAIVIEGGKLCLLEGQARYILGLPVKGAQADERALVALGLADGKVLWRQEDVHPQAHSLWMDRGVVVATPVPYSRSMQDPAAHKAGGGIAAYDAADGKALWRIDKVDKLMPMMLDGVFYSPAAHDIRTGQPIASQAGGKQFSAGMASMCATLSGCATMAMTRRTSMGFQDLAGQSGTYLYPIIRASCWINMIPAGGLIVVPEGSSSCQCAFNYKTSIALMNDKRHFHFGQGGSGSVAEQALRINFGAPGDRADANGRMWYAWPRPTAYGRCLGSQPYAARPAAPAQPIDAVDCEPVDFGRNPDWVAISGSEMPWLDSFGLAGQMALAIRPPRELASAQRLRVTLYFCRIPSGGSAQAPWEKAGPFDVQLQGRTLLKAFQPPASVDGVAQAVAKTFTIPAADRIELRLTPTQAGAVPTIAGVAIEAEE